MRLMLDVTEYVELPGILPTLHAFTEAVYLARGVFHKVPIEFVVPTLVLRDLLRVVDNYGKAAVTIDRDGVTSIAGVQLIQTDKDVAVRLVFSREQLAMRPVHGE